MYLQLSLNLEQQMDEFGPILERIKKVETLTEKITVLNQIPFVVNYFETDPFLNSLTSALNLFEEYVVKSVIAIQQAPYVFNSHNQIEEIEVHFKRLLKILIEVENFYSELGGIIGYHLIVLKLIANQQKSFPAHLKNKHYLHPEGLYLGDDNLESHEVVRWGIENLDKMAEMYPIGGAGDRLNFRDEKTNQSLPAALLPFSGQSLLKGLIRDVEAREYLYYKIFKRKICTPLAFMTSDEKNNHTQIIAFCEASQWFGRPKESFTVFKQPLAPVITLEGNWSVREPLRLNLKPNGHGVIWKIAESEGFFEKVEKIGKTCCTIRQINNPLGGIDSSLLALIGTGCQKNKAFGFVSCERLLNSEEGTNLIIQTTQNQKYHYCLTNIEYTDFVQHGVGEIPLEAGSQYSLYPTNTNILFAQFSEIRNALKKQTIPGQLINLKSKFPSLDPAGNLTQAIGGRLESTMQNIADTFTDSFTHPLNKEDLKNKLHSFIVYNDRLKVISTTKKCYHEELPSVGTPEQAFHDLLLNHYCLLQSCGFQLPKWKEIDYFLHEGPCCIFLFDPKMGPLFSVIRQKIRGGVFHEGAEMQLEIAEVTIENLEIEGSLIVDGTNQHSLNKDHGNSIIESRCSFKNVKILNQGIDFSQSQPFWKNQFCHQESLKIILEEGSEFQAEDVIIEGNHEFKVPPHHLLIIKGYGREWTPQYIPLSGPSWEWHYYFDENNQVKIEKRYFPLNIKS